MNNAKQFFHDLYRDLSDRRLLIPAIVLLVAILAVPMLLKSSPAETPLPTAVAPVDDADATQVESAVLVTDPGIRDYSERLEALKKKNPFIQQFAADEADTGAAPTDAAADLAAGAVAGDTTGATAPTVPGTETAADTSTTTDGTGTDTVGADGTPDTTPDQPTPQTRFFAPRVDVSFGELGDAEKIDDVRHFDFLPDEKSPVVAFLGLGESADKAVFAVSNEVTETSGEGSCSPHESQGCDLLILRIGEERRLKVETGGEYGETVTYRLKVLDTDYTRIPDPREDDEPDAGQ